MAEDKMLIGDLIGKTITDIRCLFGVEDGWLDTSYCFIEIDQQFFIEFPFSDADVVWITEPDPNANTIFDNLNDMPYYFIDPPGITGGATADTSTDKNIFFRLRNFFSKSSKPWKEKPSYRVEYQENKLKHILNRKIADYLWQAKDDERGFFELDNGYLITEKNMAPSGTGLAGLHYYTSFENLKNTVEGDFCRYSELNNNDQNPGIAYFI
jgi:hypothetical protein